MIYLYNLSSSIKYSLKRENQGCKIPLKHILKYYSKINKWILLIVAIMVMGIVTPALADYLGPNRIVTESVSSCKVILLECQYVPSKDDWRYHKVEGWACSDENKPWKAYSSEPSSQGCYDATAGHQFWERTETSQVVTSTYPPATINGSLQNCTLQNGWCVTTPQLSLSASEPVSGYSILAIEGSLNGQTFACPSSGCNLSLNEGDNSLAYWALSSWGDSSTMGTLTTKVDSQLPSITGIFTGTSGSNGWYISPVSFTGNSSDATSGLASFTCSLDGVTLASCGSITISSEGAHTIVLNARDNAGNTRTLPRNTSLDTQNPVLNASLSGSMGSNNWYTSATLNASASDAAPGSGLSVFEYNLDNNGWMPFPASGVLDFSDGKHSIDIRAIDNAGRTVSSTKPFWLDTVTPNITLDPAGTFGLNDWYISNLTIVASANDATSGIDVFEYSLDNSTWATYSTPLTIADGTHSLSFWAQDSAGLVTQVDHPFKVDTRAPQISGSLNGVLGANGWYVSDVTLSASASDPTPGSGLDAFTYTLNGNAETPYTNALTLSDGQHTVQLNTQDEAGLTYSTEQVAIVDTIRPSLMINTTLENWIKGNLILNGTADDSGSGISKIEISTDGGQIWQAVTGTTSWGYTWNTAGGPNGIHSVKVHVIDHAALITEHTINTGVDNISPKISLPESWYQWDTITLDIWDNHSGLSEARVEISDPEGRWPKRVIRLNPERFPLEFKWDRRFGDDTIAPLGIYDVKVIAFDDLGNMAHQGASINILLGILPAGPTATPQPYSRAESIPTSVVFVATPISSPAVTQSAVVTIFGIAPEPAVQAIPISDAILTPRAAPGQTGVLDWLQSIFVPNTTEESITEIGSVQESKRAPQPTTTENSSVLWGATAAAVIGAATAYALEEKRKRKEEEARQAAEVRAEVDAKNAAIQASQQAKREAMKIQNWLQGQSILNGQIEEVKKQGGTAEQIFALNQMGATQGLGAAIGSAGNLTKSLYASSLKVSANKRTDYKEALVEEEMKSYGVKLRESESASNKDIAHKAIENWYKAEQEVDAPPKEVSWWDKTKSFTKEKILQPFNTYVFQPFVGPAIEKTEETVKKSISWVNENVYQPYVKPAMERTKQSVLNESAWINEKIYQPYIKPVVERTKQFVINESAWVNENIYQPYISQQWSERSSL